jgi:DNA-binding transcriptional ArsR family regulator
VPTTFEFRASDWARCRFVRSLLWETLHAVRTLIAPEQQRYHRAWLETIDREEALRRLPLLLALNPQPGWVPDYLTPPPRARSRGIEAELAAMARQPLDAIAYDIQRSLASDPSRSRRARLEPLIADPARALELTLAEQRYAWSELLEPFWSRVRGLVDADVSYRGDVVAQHGFAAAVGDLDPRVTLSDDTVRVARTDEGRIDLGGRGLALMPSAFVWPSVVIVHESPWPPTLVYPARGVGDLWADRRRAPAGLAGALGRTRALLLDDLDQPATTTALAARNALSMASVSTQLRRLDAAGLVRGQRVGKEVRYRRTALGESLLRANRG